MGKSRFSLTFELARLEHAKAIAELRDAVAADLYAKLGEGRADKKANLQTIRDRIKSPDTVNLHHRTLFVACRDGEVVGSVSLSTWPPNFWKKHYWREPGTKGLGVIGLAVFPHLQRLKRRRSPASGLPKLFAVLLATTAVDVLWRFR